MKVLVINSAIPFARGAAERLADHLVDHLNRRAGTQAELLRIPFRPDPAERLVEEILINRQLRLPNVDRVIGLRFPAYLLPHPDKTLWILEPFRLNGSGGCSLGERATQLAQIVCTAEQQCFRSCRHLFTTSPGARDQLKGFNDFGFEVLYPPLTDPELFSGGEYRHYIFAGGRIAPEERQHLLVEAMRFVRAPLRLLISGPTSTQEYANQLEQLIVRYSLEDRVRVESGFRDRKTIAGYVNNSLACASISTDELSAITGAMDALCASKAVLTAHDSGGLLELIIDGVTGAVAAPDPTSLGDAIERLGCDPVRTRSLGQEAIMALRRNSVNWDSTIAALLG